MPEYCHRCQRVTESRAVTHGSGVEFVCVTCGWQVDYMFDEHDDDDSNEPVSSCEKCGSNVYESEDDGSGLCDACAWSLRIAGGIDEDGWEMVG